MAVILAALPVPGNASLRITGNFSGLNISRLDEGWC